MLAVAVLPMNEVVALLALSVASTCIAFWAAMAGLRFLRTKPAALALGNASTPPSQSVPLGFADRGTVGHDLLRLVREQTDARFAALFLTRHGDDCLIVTGVDGEADGLQDAELAYRHPLMRYLATEGEPVEITEVEPELSLPPGSVLFPLRSAGHLIAVLAAGPRYDGRAIPQRSILLIKRAAEQAAAPLGNAQLYQSLRQAFTEVENARRELLALQRVSAAAQSAHGLRPVLGQIAQGVSDGLGFDLVLVYLADATNGTISLPVSSHRGDVVPEEFEPLAVSRSHPTMRALLSNEVLVTHDLSESLLPEFAAASAVDASLLPPNPTLANLPLVSKGRIIGGMLLGTGRVALSGTEIESLRSFAVQAAATIENARVYEELLVANRDLRAAQDQLIQAERLRTLGQVATGVAHDFNNILAAILTRVQLAEQMTRSPALRETLKVIEQAALDGANAARRIQRLGRPSEDREPETLDLSAIAQQAIELTRPMWANAARARGVKILAETELAANAFVTGQAGELREVFTNLILNAAAAMPAGGTLTVRTARGGDDVWCTVEDTGIGMSEEVRARVFEPFYSTKGEAGSGLGMSIVAAIRQRHNGRVEIDSGPGRGTSVRFCLPAASALSAVKAPLRRRGHVSLRVAITSEDEAGRDALALLLRRHGHYVHTAANAEETIKLLMSEEFDVVVTDLGLGNHSGWEVAEATKVIRPSAAVVLSTAWTEEWDSAEVSRRGVDGILSKPYTVDDVLTCLENALVHNA